MFNFDEPFGSCIFCDDVRQEVGGKQSYMGVYYGALFVPVLPITIPKFAIVVTFYEPKRSRRALPGSKNTKIKTHNRRVPEHDFAPRQHFWRERLRRKPKKEIRAMADDLEAARAKHRHNQMMTDRIKGVPATPGTPESAADPRNPSVISPAPTAAEVLALTRWLSARIAGFMWQEGSTPLGALAAQQAVEKFREVETTLRSYASLQADLKVKEIALDEAFRVIERLKEQRQSARDAALEAAAQIAEGSAGQLPKGQRIEADGSEAADLAIAMQHGLGGGRDAIAEVQTEDRDEVDPSSLPFIPLLPSAITPPDGGGDELARLIGARIIRIGTTTPGLVEGGGLIIDYRRADGLLERLVLAFSERGMWVEHSQPLPE